MFVSEFWLIHKLVFGETLSVVLFGFVNIETNFVPKKLSEF